MYLHMIFYVYHVTTSQPHDNGYFLSAPYQSLEIFLFKKGHRFFSLFMRSSRMNRRKWKGSLLFEIIVAWLICLFSYIHTYTFFTLSRSSSSSIRSIEKCFSFSFRTHSIESAIDRFLFRTPTRTHWDACTFFCLIIIQFCPPSEIYIHTIKLSVTELVIVIWFVWHSIPWRWLSLVSLSLSDSISYWSESLI